MSTSKSATTATTTMTITAKAPTEVGSKVAGDKQKSYGKIVLTLENCLLPEAKLEMTPSQADGLDRETEIDLRILGCELIQTAGILLKLPQVAMATGQVLFQRFFYSKSFVRHSMEATAMSCVCLASKIEEAPRRIRDVINVFHHIKQVRGQNFVVTAPRLGFADRPPIASPSCRSRGIGIQPSVQKGSRAAPLLPMILDQHYINLKSQVIKAERRVLKELGFCVHVKHPHKLIVMYLKYLELEKHQNMMQMAWNFMNDSFRTDVFVRYQPETIACACIYLTARKQNIPLPANPGWFLIFRVSEEDMLDVCYRIMSLYKRPKPNADALDSAVDALKKKYQDQKKKERSDASTPPTVVMVDRNNGSHNAWGGFISRALPASTGGSGGDNDSGNNGNNNEKDGKKSSQSKSRSRSPRSNSRSRSPHSRSVSRSTRSNKSASRSPASRSRSRGSSDVENAGSRKSSKKSRHRSRSPISKSSGAKRKSKQHSRSRSGSPESPKYKKSSSDKKYDRRRDDRDGRYINGSDGRGDKRSSRDHRDRHHGSSKYDQDDYRKGYRSSRHGNGGDKRDKYGSSSGHRHHSSSSGGHRSSKHGDRDRDRRR